MFVSPVLAHRLFFALKPPQVRSRQLAAAAPWIEAAGQAVAADRLHITLFILDDRPRVTGDLLAALNEMGARVATAPFEVVLDRAVGSQSSIALRPSRRNDGLASLHRQLTECAKAAGVEQRHEYRFNPHLTLGYRDGEPFQQPITPVRWQAQDMVLIHSHLGRTRHEEIGRWPLRRRADPQLALL